MSSNSCRRLSKSGLVFGPLVWPLLQTLEQPIRFAKPLHLLQRVHARRWLMHSQAQVAAFFQERYISLQPAWLATAYAHAVTLQAREPLTETVSRLWLAADLTSSTAAHSLLPPLPDDMQAGGLASTMLTRPIVVQILSIQEIGQSFSSQLDALETLREKQKPVERRLVRLAEEKAEDGGPQPIAPATAAAVNAGPLSLSKKMLRLVIQDAQGQQRIAIEQTTIPQLDLLHTPIGKKLLLDAGSAVMQGVILLKPPRVRLLGGGFREARAVSIPDRLQHLEDRLKTQQAALPAAGPLPVLHAAPPEAQQTHGDRSGRGRGRGRGRGGRGRGHA